MAWTMETNFPYDKNLGDYRMFDFIINMVADIAEIFIDLWVDMVINQKKKVNSVSQ